MIMRTDNLMMQHHRHQMSAPLDILYEPSCFYEDWASSGDFFNAFNHPRFTCGYRGGRCYI